MTTIIPAPTPVPVRDEPVAGCPAEVGCGCETLGYITRCDALWEVLEVVAPYDLAYLPTLAEAIEYFECLADDTVTLRPA